MKMGPNSQKPYIDQIQIHRGTDDEFDLCFFGYADRRIFVSITEYAVLEGLIAGKIDIGRINDIRRTFKSDPHQRMPAAQGDISRAYLSLVLNRLRKKISKKFPDLVIPQGVSHAELGLRLMTRQELLQLRGGLISDCGTRVVRDEHGASHLFVDGRSISPRHTVNGGIAKTDLAIASILLMGRMAKPYVAVQYKNPEFWQAMDRLCGVKSMSLDVFNGRLLSLERAFKQIGWRISRSKNGVRSLRAPLRSGNIRQAPSRILAAE